MRGWWQDLTDLVLPAECGGCGAPRTVLCPECRAVLSGTVPCRVRPEPEPVGLPAVHAAARYADEVRAVLLAHKERGALALSAPLGVALAGAVRAGLREAWAWDLAGAGHSMRAGGPAWADGPAWAGEPGADGGLASGPGAEPLWFGGGESTGGGPGFAGAERGRVGGSGRLGGGFSGADTTSVGPARGAGRGAREAGRGGDAPVASGWGQAGPGSRRTGDAAGDGGCVPEGAAEGRGGGFAGWGDPRSAGSGDPGSVGWGGSRRPGSGDPRRARAGVGRGDGSVGAGGRGSARGAGAWRGDRSVRVNGCGSAGDAGTGPGDGPAEVDGCGSVGAGARRRDGFAGVGGCGPVEGAGAAVGSGAGGVGVGSGLVAADGGLGGWAMAGGAAVLLVPVPSARRVVAARGHDPARRIALAAAGELRRAGVPARVVGVLRQRRAVADQAGLNSRERLENLAGALAVVPGGGRLLLDGPVVLVDDLMTTGASLTEAARAVRAATAAAAVGRGRNGRNSGTVAYDSAATAVYGTAAREGTGGGMNRSAEAGMGGAAGMVRTYRAGDVICAAVVAAAPDSFEINRN